MAVLAVSIQNLYITELINFQKYSLLAIVDISTAQSSAQTFIHNAILFIDTSDNA